MEVPWFGRLLGGDALFRKAARRGCHEGYDEVNSEAAPYKSNRLLGGNTVWGTSVLCKGAIAGGVWEGFRWRSVSCGGDAVVGGVWHGRRHWYVDWWKISIGVVAKCGLRCPHKLIFVTSVVGLGRKVLQVKPDVKGPASYWMSD